LLYNKTKKTKVIDKVLIADNFFKKLKGLMFEKKIDYALIFPLSFESRINASIHMFFVFFPIDVLFLNSKKKVVDKKENLKPFTLICIPRKPASFVIELPLNKAKNIELNDELEW